jgi:hypothetical protein
MSDQALVVIPFAYETQIQVQFYRCLRVKICVMVFHPSWRRSILGGDEAGGDQIQINAKVETEVLGSSGGR